MGAWMIALDPGAPDVVAANPTAATSPTAQVRAPAALLEELLAGSGHVQSSLEERIEPSGLRPMVLDLLNEVIW